MEHFRGFSTYIGQNTDNLSVGHRIALIEITLRRTCLSVRTSELADDYLCGSGIRVLYVDGIFESFLYFHIAYSSHGHGVASQFQPQSAVMIFPE